MNNHLYKAPQCTWEKKTVKEEIRHTRTHKHHNTILLTHTTGYNNVYQQPQCLRKYKIACSSLQWLRNFLNCNYSLMYIRTCANFKSMLRVKSLIYNYKSNIHFQHRILPCLILKCSISHCSCFGAYLVKICSLCSLK